MFCLSSPCWQIVHKGSVMQKFHDVTVEIEAALTQIPYDHFEVSEEVIEQVLLTAFVFFFISRLVLNTQWFANSNDIISLNL